MTATIAFLGSGNMNGAILRGLLAAGHPADAIRATTLLTSIISSAGEAGRTARAER
ncbi:NAD(P)-binding domain-containing protein, partial [Galactobacter sp.]|uniref:NAD(P)-binding domain-containing protein n=1 Tax=Galactobacter sp. TaxID=2676125 RepID=UPI0025BFA7DC